MRSEPLVDAHVHLYADPAAGLRAKERYLIWEYGDDPGVAFSPAPGDVGALASVYEKAGFDHAIVVHLFDTTLVREQLAEHLGAAEAAEAAGDVLRAADLSALIRRIGADRVMLGSDFPWYDPLRTADRVAGLPGLTGRERAAILGGTAMRVFGLG